MARNVDCYCGPCDLCFEAICSIDARPPCPKCGGPTEQQWWKRRAQDATVWHPSEWATVFRKPDGTFSYPMHSDKPTPEGCERITIRSDAEMAKHEREGRVLSERRWFDGSNEFKTQTPQPTPRRDTFSE